MSANQKIHNFCYSADHHRYNQVWFWRRCAFPRWGDWDVKYTGKGLMKMRLTQLVKGLSMTALILAAYYSRKNGTGLRQQALVMAANLKESVTAMLR